MYVINLRALFQPKFIKAHFTKILLLLYLRLIIFCLRPLKIAWSYCVYLVLYYWP